VIDGWKRGWHRRPVRFEGSVGQELRIYAGVSVGVGLMWLSETTAKEVWPDATPLLVVGAAVLMLFMARAIRALPKERVKPPGGLVVAALVVPAIAVVMFVRLVAPTVSESVANLELHDRTIDDLTIALPSGTEKSTTGETSSLRIHDAGGLDLAVSVLWMTGELTPDGAHEFVDFIAGKVNAPRPVALPDGAVVVGGGLPQHSYRMDVSGTHMVITVFPCGEQVFAVFVTGAGAGGVAPRILASVRCRAS
jgi:hypothetical protein